MTNTTVTRNDVKNGAGGGIYNEGTLTLLGTTVKANKGALGSDLYNDSFGVYYMDSTSRVGKVYG